VISLGTNTARVLIVRFDGAGVEQLEHRAIGTRLGEGLRERGALGEAAMQRTLDAVRAFTQVAREHGAALDTIATSAVRRADNREEFAARMRAITGVELQVLTGDREAAASYTGATYGHADGTRVAVLDIGGGSTECAAGRDGVLDRGVSCEIGSVRLAEHFPGLMGSQAGPVALQAAVAAEEFAANALEPLAAFAGVDELRAVAGTATTVAAVAFELSVEAVRGRVLERATVRRVLDRLLALPLAARKELRGMLPQRADILPAGAILLLESMRRLGVDRTVVETNDLLLGFLLNERK
jgi:exopolyphosphatase/guanosine-5'-triphosphate,3'-diphosphate pyrophosphatase